jgi:putative transposase
MANTYTQIYIHIVFAVAGRFSWQEGFGGFSYSHSQLSTVIRYIQNQQEHHRRKSFSEEYVELSKRFNVSHDQRYIFQPVDPD